MQLLLQLLALEMTSVVKPRKICTDVIHGPFICYVVIKLNLPLALAFVPPKQTHLFCEDIQNLDVCFWRFNKRFSKIQKATGPVRDGHGLLAAAYLRVKRLESPHVLRSSPFKCTKIFFGLSGFVSQCWAAQICNPVLAFQQVQWALPSRHVERETLRALSWTYSSASGRCKFASKIWIWVLQVA